MNTTRKITKIGNSAGIILPKEVLARLGAVPGDRLAFQYIPNGIEIFAKKPDIKS